ncbi:MAG: hypothetical protein AABY22_22570 [Nanoarchaeota archaeon]
MKHLSVKCDDTLNFFQSKYKLGLLTIFKADSGYRIVRAKTKKMFMICVKHPLVGIKEFESISCTYYLKKNGFIKVLIK